MKVFLNRQEICVGSRATLKELLLGQSITPEGIAVARQQSNHQQR